MFTKEKFLKDKIDLHIKSPETREEYVKLIQKLIDLGGKTYNDTSAETLFYNDWIYLPYIDDHLTIHPRNNPDGKKEIQISDIIGPKFELGKWYKWYQEDHNISNIGKCARIDLETNTLVTIPWIVRCAGFKNEGYFNLDKATNIEELTDLSEIQQYLPEGHPDKVSKSLTVDDLVEGDVYYHKCLRYSYIVKFRKLDGISITGEYCIDLENNNYYKNYRNTSITELRPATPSEKKWLLTCIKQDKFIKQSELDKYDDEGNLINEFKVGDYAISLIDTAYGRKKGDLLLITGIESYVIKGSEREEIFYGDINTEKIRTSLRHATPEEIAKVSKPKSKTTEVNRNVYYEVSNQDQYNEILDWLENTGEEVIKGSRVTENWKYIYKNNAWCLYDIKPNLPKAEFKFKNTSNKCGVCEDKGDRTYDVFYDPCPECNGEGYVEEKIIEPKQSHRTIPTVEKVTNRFKASPVRKRSLPEIY